MKIKMKILQLVKNEYSLLYFCRSRGSAGKGKDSEYENMESDAPEDEDRDQVDGMENRPLGGDGRDSEQREIDEFEEEERKLLAEDSKTCSGSVFAIPGRWTGGKREEEEMRRMMAQQALAAAGETSQEEWSEDDEGARGGYTTDEGGRGGGYTTDEGGMDHLSMANECGLTDAEGALSDVNSMYECPDLGAEGDMDDTSLSSRASSRIFDSDQIYSADSIHGMYDSEYDNYSRHGNMTSDAESDFAHEDMDSDVGAALDELNMENIRQMSKDITNKFGGLRSDKEDGESDALET